MPRRTDIASVYRRDAPRVNATRIGDERWVPGFDHNGNFVTRSVRESERAAIGDLPPQIAVQNTKKVNGFKNWKSSAAIAAAFEAMDNSGEPLSERPAETVVDEPPTERSFRAMATPTVGPLILGVGIASTRGASAAIPPYLGTVTASFPPEAQAA